jgi:hypothetical protein
MHEDRDLHPEKPNIYEAARGSHKFDITSFKQNIEGRHWAFAFWVQRIEGFFL